MKDSKLIKNLSVLTEKELRQFGDFVHSPFFNKHKETILFFDLLFDEFGRWNRLNKERVFAHIFPDQHFKEHSVNNLMFNLMDLYRQFLGQKIYLTDQHKSIDTITGAYEKNLLPLSKSLVEKEITKAKKEKIKDLNHYQRLFKLNDLNDQIANTFQQKIEENALQNAGRDLETAFIINKLRICCDMLDRMVVYKHRFDLGMINQLLGYLKERWDYFGKVLLINIYYQILNIHLKPLKHKHLENLLKLLEQNRGHCNLEDMTRLYSYSINIGIELLNRNSKRYSRSVFQLYLMQIEDGLHLKRGEIEHMPYKNIITLACRLGEFDWAKKFMDDNRNNLNISIRKNIYNFNLAYLYYNQQEYQKALVLLSKLNYENEFYQINTKLMQVKIFFELKEYEVLLSFLESFRLFLTRAKNATPDRIKMTVNFVFYTRKFIQQLNSKNIQTKNQFELNLKNLKQEILPKNIAMIGKDWILENIDLALSNNLS